MNANLTVAIERLKEKGEAFGQALAAEQTLERQRPLLKELAIRRIMERDRCSASAAKDIANSDLEYMNHKVAQGESVVLRYRAEAEFEAAKAEATQASLITPAMLALQEEIDDLTISVLDKNDQIGEYAATLRTVKDSSVKLAAQRAELRDANATLVNTAHELAGQLAVANEMIQAQSERISELKAFATGVPS